MKKHTRQTPKRLAGKSPDELLGLARATGATDRMQLWKADQALARELSRHGVMDQFAPIDRRDPRTAALEAMTDEELLAEAHRLIAVRKWQCMKELDDHDYKLADQLRARNLTRLLAARYGWRTRRRTGSAAKQDDPRSANSRDLIDRAIALEATGLNDLHQKDSVLYKTIRDNPDAREGLRKALSLRRKPVAWSEMSDEDWFSLAREFENASQMKDLYQAAWTNAGRLGKRQMISNKMVSEGSWEVGLYDKAGVKCDSVAEMLLFNSLHCAKVEFVHHPVLPIKGRRRAPRADAYLPQEDSYIEVWACSAEGLQQRGDSLPEHLRTYVTRRQKKLAGYKAAGLTVISIEAEVARLQNTKAFVQHIVDVLNPICGVTRHDPQDLRISGVQPALDWGIEEFLEFARKKGLTKLSDFQEHPYREFYNILKRRNLRDAVREALDREYGRRSFVRRNAQIDVDDCARACMALNIGNRAEYVAARQQGLLPLGAPACIRQAYGLTWAEFFRMVRTLRKGPRLR